MKIKGFVLLYIVLVAIDLYAMYNYPGARLVTKPLILASLLIWYITSVLNKQRPAILLALIFSLIGDLLLLYNSEFFFMAGVGAFLLAQICYAFYFRKFANFKLQSDKIKTALVLITASVFYFVLYQHLGEMKIPVLFYTLALTAMIVYAVCQKLSSFIAIGAMLFMISDMSLGLQKFVIQTNSLDLLIMITYTAAQYLIVKGIIDGQTKPV